MILMKSIHLIHVKAFRNLAAGRIKRRRTIMNCVEDENVAVEDFASEKEYKAPRAMGRDQPRGGMRRGNRVDCRVAEVLDLELARGSMPT
jgi:hypothetical protein